MNTLTDFHPDFLVFNKLFELDAVTGFLFWKESRGRVSKGSQAGTMTHHGYRQVRVDGKFYKASRIVWLLCYGVWPTNEIDHLNRDRADDRPENLADVTRAVNACNRGMQSNNTTGYPGIRHKNGQWEATRNKIYLGRFNTLDEARRARREA